MPPSEAKPSCWTFATLEKYLSDRIDALRDLMEERFDAADKALSKAEMSSEKRFESVNEFRSQLADQAGTLLPRAEYNVQLSSFSDRLNAINGIVSRLDNRMTTMEASQITKKETVASSTGMVVAIVTVVYGVITAVGIVLTLVLRH